MTNYWYWKNRRKKIKAASLSELPTGTWVTVREAAKRLKLTTQAVRYRYLRGELEVADVNGRIFVNIGGV